MAWKSCERVGLGLALQISPLFWSAWNHTFPATSRSSKIHIRNSPIFSGTRPTLHTNLRPPREKKKAPALAPILLDLYNAVMEISQEAFSSWCVKGVFIFKSVFHDPAHLTMIILLMGTLVSLLHITRAPKKPRQDSTETKIKIKYERLTPEDFSRFKAFNNSGYPTFTCKHCTRVATCAPTTNDVPVTCVAHAQEGYVKVFGCRIISCRKRQRGGGFCVQHQGS